MLDMDTEIEMANNVFTVCVQKFHDGKHTSASHGYDSFGHTHHSGILQLGIEVEVAYIIMMLIVFGYL